MRGSGSIAAIILMLPSGVIAQEKGATFLDAFARCRSMASGDPLAKDQRLFCYDKAFDQIEAARQRGEVAVVGRADVQRARARGFGFAPARTPDVLPTARVETPPEVNTTIAVVTTPARGVFRLRMADGAVWQLTDDVVGLPKAGEPVRIRRTQMGGYLLNISKSRAVRAIRVR